VRRLYRRIAALPDLAPGPLTDAAFTELVRLTTAPSSTDTQRAVLADPNVRALTPHLRRLCGAAEYELERRWATRVVASTDPGVELRAFPYYDNYRRLTRLEYHTVTGLTGARPARVAFVGSGPLPLTSVLLGARYRVRVDNIDIDPAATRSAGQLADALRANRLRFHTADILDHHDFAAYDAVWLAALVGRDDAHKRTVLAHLFDQLRPGTLLLARSAHGLRTLLYPSLTLEDLGDFEPLAVLHPYSEIVNSMVVARKP
jgi:SAM-dependent methyltransferase